MGLPVRRVGGGPGHHHLARARGVAVPVPLRAQAHELAVEVDADAPAHAHDHRLAVHGLQALFEMVHDVAGHERHPLRGPDDGFELRPLGLQPFAAVDLLALGGLLEAGVDVRPLVLVQGQPGEAALVVDGHRRPVLDRASDVVDADVVAEHGAGAGVFELDRGAGEADERGVGQGVAHVARVAVDEVVLAAMGLVGDHHDVAPGGERRPLARTPGDSAARNRGRSGRRRRRARNRLVPFGQRGPIVLLLGEELLDGGEHHAAGFHREPGAQIRPARGLHGRLAQQVGAAREGGEELVVEVVAVGQHDDGGVLHRRLADDAPGIEGHGQALARALGVPDDADAPVARRAAGGAAGLVAALLLGNLLLRPLPLQLRRAQGLGHRRPDRMELVVARHLLDQSAAAAAATAASSVAATAASSAAATAASSAAATAASSAAATSASSAAATSASSTPATAAAVLEHDEVADEGQEAGRRAGAFEHHLQLRKVRVGQHLAGDRAPGLEPFPPGGQRADPGFEPVRHDERGVEGEQRRDLRLVGLQLPVRRCDGGVLVGRVLELDDGQRQAIDEQHHVGAALAPVLHDGELVDREPVVGLPVVEVDHPGLRAPDRAAPVAVLHRHAVHRHAMKGAVAGHERRPFRTGELAPGVVEGFVRQVRVQPGERGPQTLPSTTSP